MLSASARTQSGDGSTRASSTVSGAGASSVSMWTPSAVASTREATMRGHHEGTLYHNKKRGLYIAKVSLPDGRRLELSSTVKATAKGYLAEMLRLVGKGVTPNPRLTVAAFLAGWLIDVRTTLRPQTWQRYESIVRIHLTPGIGSLGLQALRPSTVDRFLATRQGRTAQLCREVGRNALNSALHDRIVEYNAFELSKAVHHEAKDAAILTPEELARLLEATADDRLHALYVLASTTGMREAELLGLAWTDIDWVAGTITVQSQLIRLSEKMTGTPGGEWVLAAPKTRKGRRTIKVAKMTMEALKAHRLRMGAQRTPDWQYWQLAFVTEQGQPFYGYRVVNMLRGHLASLAIETSHPLKLHELRHGLATYMKADGVTDEALAAYLGHSTTRLLERYAHAMPGSDGQVAERIQARFR